MIDKYGNHPANRPIKKIKVPKDRVAVLEGRRVKFYESEENNEEEVQAMEPVVNTPIEETKIETPTSIESQKKEKRVRPPRRKKGKKFDFHNVPLPVIRVLGTIISLIALIRSFGYVWSYFLRVDTVFFATLMALMLVLVVFLAPQVLLHAVRAKKWFVGFLAIVLMVVFTFLNIWVTVNGLTYARAQSDYYVSSGQEHIVKAKRRIEEINTKLIEIKEDKARDAIKRDSLQAEFNRLISIGETTTTYYYTTRNSLRDIETTYRGYDSRLTELEKEKKSLEDIEGLDSVVIKDEETKKKESGIDFLFAIAMDITGPVFLTFALFL